MAVYTVTHAWRQDDYGAVQVLEELDGLGVGSSVTLAGSSVTGLDGTHTVVSLSQWEYVGTGDEGDLVSDTDVRRVGQIVFADTGDDVARTTSTGTVTFAPVATWITSADVLVWLGIDVASANDTLYVAECVNAANAFAYRRRQQAGYRDALGTAPSADVKLGTTTYAAALYRERGSVDGFASFETMTPAPLTFTMGRILQLLGINRPQIG